MQRPARRSVSCRLVDRSGLVYVLDGVNDGDSRWSPGILRDALIPSAGFNQCRNCIVESEMKSSQMKTRPGRIPRGQTSGRRERPRVPPTTWPRPIGSRSASSPSSPSERSPPSSGRRRSARWRGTGARGGNYRRGSTSHICRGALRLCGSIDGHHETR